MKRVAFFSLGWSLASSPEIQEQDKARVTELLQDLGRGNKYTPQKNWYPIRVDVGSKEFEMLIQVAQESDLVYLNRIERVYTDHELSSALLLVWRLTNQAVEDDYYDLREDGYQGGPQSSHRRCAVCRAESEQVRDLLVDVRKMGKRDLSLTYSFEIILSPHLAQMLQEVGFTGFTLRPVWHYRRAHRGEPPLYQMVMTNLLPPMASPPTEFEHEQRCEVCGTETKFIKHTHWWGRIRYYEETEIYYSKSVLERVADFNVTWEKIGELPSWSRLVIITQRVYRWLREQKVKGWGVEPVYLVE